MVCTPSSLPLFYSPRTKREKIPLPPEKVIGIWKAVKNYDFTTTHGAFNGMDVRDEKLKGRVLESAKIFVKAMGYHDDPIHLEAWEG